MNSARLQPLNDEHCLVLPFENACQWEKIEATLRKQLTCLADLDELLNEFSTTDQTCHFFTRIPDSEEAKKFDFDCFWRTGVPLMVQLALEMPSLFHGVKIPLLLARESKSVSLSRRQCACLLAHSFFGSITAAARTVKKEKWAFRASQLFFLEAVPSALCFLNYFKVLGQGGVPEGSVVFQRRSFPRGKPPWRWEDNAKPLCSVEILPSGTISQSPAERHADFANRFIGGGCLENDFMMEEILFVTKPELIVSMALCSYMQDEDVVLIHGASQYSSYSGYGHSFTFEGDYQGIAGPIASVVAMDALQGLSKIQFKEGLIRRDLNKARLAFDGARSVATGNWGCGAFGNDHVLKFVQQWLAASEAGVQTLYYYTFADKRAAELPLLMAKLSRLSVGQLWNLILTVANTLHPGPTARSKFRSELKARAEKETLAP